MRWCLFPKRKNKRGSALLIVLLVLTFLTGVNYVVSERAHQRILTLKDEQRLTKSKILANEFLIQKRKENIKNYGDKRFGTVELNNGKNLTIKVTKGKTVEVELNRNGY